MRTVYVVTTAPGVRARTVRAVLLLILARIVYALAWTGHALGQAAGAVDAVVTARLGIPRMAVLARRARAALHETWEA
ncbi:hypothetical protein AB0K05_25015 [Nonomuraea sp. NPDC049486]|uniref:hypothetical protein n=1 Tax=Nonomuraea sp. NPDC049486 TaxID=3155773 RepID=UPI0034443CD7